MSITTGIAGLSGWKRSDLADGTERWLLQDQVRMYEITPMKLLVMAGVANDAPATAVDALLAMQRLNVVAFPDDSKSAAQMVLDMVKKVSADPEEPVVRRRGKYRATMKMLRELGLISYSISGIE